MGYFSKMSLIAMKLPLLKSISTARDALSSLQIHHYGAI